MEKLKRLLQKHKKVPKTQGCEEDKTGNISATSENKVTKSYNLNCKKTERTKQKCMLIETQTHWPSFSNVQTTENLE